MVPRLLVLISLLGLPAGAQQLLDRVVARVNGAAVTQTDVDAAVGLGVIDAAGPDRAVAAVRQMIDRRLMLAEVGRFPPPEPSDTAVAERVASMHAYAGTGLSALLRRTGLDDERVRAMARDSLRIEAYVAQRFGTTSQVSLQEARDYYDSHPDEFSRNGVVRPYEQVETEARAAASAERRRRLIAQWIADLRTRGDVVEVTSRP